MAIDRLQEKLRKLKNPCAVDFGADKEHIPPHILQQEHSFTAAYGRFCTELLEGLKGIVPAVRFSFGSFAMLGTDGLTVLARLLDQARSLGYYVILDLPEALSAMSARNFAKKMLEANSMWSCDGMVISAYIGTDSIKPFISGLKESGKDLFVVLRTSNKTAPEVQDLLTGGRLVHMAITDNMSRLGEDLIGRCGYSQLAGLAAAASADSLRALRTKYKNLFLLLDGSDYPNASANNCSNAFDRLGHGAAACVGLSVTAAWQKEDSNGLDYVECARRSAERIKRNFSRYITIL